LLALTLTLARALPKHATNTQPRTPFRHLINIVLMLAPSFFAGDTGQCQTPTYFTLHELSQQISNSSIRVPMHVLHRGEDMLRREVLKNNEADGEKERQGQ